MSNYDFYWLYKRDPGEKILQKVLDKFEKMTQEEYLQLYNKARDLQEAK